MPDELSFQRDGDTSAATPRGRPETDRFPAWS